MIISSVLAGSLPLAITSTAGWIRRLGGRRWQTIHRMIYASATLGVLHYYWLVKSDIRKPVFYGALVLLLLGYRAASTVSKRRAVPIGAALVSEPRP